MQTQTSCFEQLKELVSPKLIHYREDLDHDQALLEKFPTTPFLHWTRRTGTTISLLFPADAEQFPAPGEKVPYLFGTATREELSRKPLEVAQCLKNQADATTCYFDGQTLTVISTDKAISIAQQYADTLCQTWRAGSA
jgi:hypothetical protein